jgi:succinate dehydrogenase/fumarate reductase flavoprotein subunit
MSKDKKVVSRRDFLVAGGAVIAAGALAACNPKTATETVTNTVTNTKTVTNTTTQTGAGQTVTKTVNVTTTAEPWLPAKWDYEADVVVVGYGGAGIIAAVTAAENGAKVICLEKAIHRGGGNTSVNLGEFVSPVNKADAIAYLTEACKGNTPDDVIEAWAEEVCKNKEFYDRMGVTYEPGSDGNVDRNNPGYRSLPGSSSMRYLRVAGLGEGWFAVMSQHIQNLGVQVIFGARGKELIQNKNTMEILGVRADKIEGGYGHEKVVGEYVVKAKRGVIMTTGGMDFNEKLKAMFHKAYPSQYYGWRLNTGDGVAMCQKAGADIWHMDVMCGGANACFVDVDPYYNFQMKVNPRVRNYMYVDRFGRRFMAEDTMVPGHSGYIMLQRWEEPACKFAVPPYWVVFDETVIQAGAMGEVPGIQYMRGLMVIPEDIGGWTEGWSEDNQREISRGWIRKGNTIEELASVMRRTSFGSDIDTDNLKTSLDKYNEFCVKGVDEDWGRGKATLLPITNPPYYAFPRTVGGITSHGGARRGPKAEVMTPDMKPIPRLFSAGSFGSVYAMTYSVTGGNGGELAAFGRIAGRSAAAMTPWA